MKAIYSAFIVLIIAFSSLAQTPTRQLVQSGVGNGRIVFKSEILNSKSEIIADVPKGVYLLRVSSSKGSAVRKLVKM